MIRRCLRGAAAALALLLAAPPAGADAACRVAFDLGSSGIRAGASGSAVTARAEIDYLGPLWAGRGLVDVIEPTIAALRDLPREGGFDPACERVGGGFSAWRLALRQDADGLVAALARIRDASGVAVLVVPQGKEGAYAHAAARLSLGSSFASSHVLDIGGGSMQIAGAEASFVAELGQKLWHRRLCRELRAADGSTCVLQALGDDELGAARRLLAGLLRDAAALSGPVSLTAISRPVTRGIRPALVRLGLVAAGGSRIEREALTQAIARLAPLSLERAQEASGADAAHGGYLLSDLLLVEGVLRATGAGFLEVAELDLTNLPGLLADAHAFEWARRHDCYLRRLRQLGEAAYASDPATCAEDREKTRR